MEQQQFEPMSVGRIFDKAFTIYRHNFVRFLTIVALIQVPIALIGLLSTNFMYGGVSAGADAGEQTVAAPRIGDPEMGSGTTVADSLRPAAIILMMSVSAVLALVGNMLCQAALAKSVSEYYLDREITVGQAYRFVLPKLLTLIGASLLVGLVVGFGFLLLVVPGVIFSLWFYLTTPCIVVEGRRAAEGMSRSRALVSGNLGKTFLVGLLAMLIAWVVAIPFGVVSGLCTKFFLRDNFMLATTVRHLANVIPQILAMPIGASAFILLYYDLRIRKEGFDLEMLTQSMSSGGEAGDVV